MRTYKKTITSGNVIEVEYYSSIRKRGLKNVCRCSNRCVSSEQQKILNDIKTKKQFARFINANFNYKNKDLFITLTSSPISEDIALKERVNFIRRLKYYRVKHGLPALKYIGVTEKGAKGKHFHHHIIINSIDVNVIFELWGHGRIKVSDLDKTNDFTGLAVYLCKECKNKHRYFKSKNLLKPKEKCIEVKKIKSENQIKPPKGYTCEYINHYVSDITGMVLYIKFVKIVS